MQGFHKGDLASRFVIANQQYQGKVEVIVTLPKARSHVGRCTGNGNPTQGGKVMPMFVQWQ
jgi:hypothetical protein